MKKLNIGFIDNGKKEDAILKIKDDSFSITTKDNSIIKIPYSDIKDYEYTQDEKLTIKRKHSSDIVIEVSFDITLINTLKRIIKQSSTQEEIKSQPIYGSKEEKELTKPLQENIVQNITNENQQNSNNKIIGAIVSIVLTIGISVAVYAYINTGNYYDSYGEGIAKRDIVNSVLIGSSVTANELKCEAHSKTNDEIKLIKCTTTKEAIIKEYGSSTIWYGYLETVGGGYYHYIDKNKDTVLAELRK